MAKGEWVMFGLNGRIMEKLEDKLLGLNGLRECHFIGGEWDGVRKLLCGYEEVRVMKSKTIENKVEHFFLRKDTSTTEVTMEWEVYARAFKFPDGVVIYRVKEKLDSFSALGWNGRDE
jgi:hypothetical protein